MSHIVALVKQSNYETESLEASIRKAIELSEFELSSARGKRILLKPNMLGAYPPSVGVTTHPNFVAACGRIFKQADATVLVGDSPNGVHRIDKTWEITGMREMCRAEGFAEARFEASGSIERGDFRIARAIFQADMIINLPKLKTHGLTVLTLAVKNLFGCINGMQKTGLHRAHPDAYDFAWQLVHIALSIKPALNIVDGIVAMEGEGPSSGDLTDLCTIIAGCDMHTVDDICCRLVGLPPMHLDTLAIAHHLNLWSEGGVTLVGDPIDALRLPSFKFPATYTRGMREWWISRLVMRLIWGHTSARPLIDETLCRRCNLCSEVCPVQAIVKQGQNKPPKIKHKLCIQCFCCHEICPYRAISLKRSPLLKAWQWIADRRIKEHQIPN